jgi:hypothetical protein
MRRQIRNVIVLFVGIVLGLAMTVAALEFDTGPYDTQRAFKAAEGSEWTEIKWPFAVDLWSVDKAFRCAAAAICGGEITLYLRAKIGFCNCTAGVADDDEVERLADIHLFVGRQTADGPGRPIAVAWMKGRSRSYSIASASPPGKSALAIAFNDRCDAIVAIAIVDHDRPAAVEQAVLDFLNGDIVLKWAKVTLGL